MKKTINLYKPVGLTPLQAVNKFKEMDTHYKGKKMSYAGRLDPMAEGVLVLLVGDENKKMKQYMGFDKEYRAEILFGLSSDSHDVLGLVEKGFRESVEIDIQELKKKIKKLKGKYEQKIPGFSSYRFKGKALFSYARSGRLDEVDIPNKVVNIKKIVIKDVYKISSKRLLKYVINKVDKVKGDFRQEEIKKRWSLLLDGEGGKDRGGGRDGEDGKDCDEKFYVMDVVIECSSGTYIRAIADDVGGDFGGGLLLSLKRLRVGKFGVRDSLRLR